MNRLASNGHSVASEVVPGAKPVSGFTPASTGMDIARPDLARKRRRRQFLWGSAAVVVIVAVSVLLSRLEPAAPKVENPWMDTVKRGQMLRQVRGNGTLVPEQIQFVQADTGGQVEQIFIQPGAAVTADTVVLELSNPELKQSAFDAEWQARAADTQLARLRVQLESDRLSQEAALATLRADATQARLEADADATLARDGLVPGITLKRSVAKADDLVARVAIEERRLEFAKESAKAQLAVQEAEGEKLRALRDLRKRQVENLRVKAGIEGVLTQLGDRELLQSGQRVTPGATLAKVVVPTRLKAEVRVAETQARDVALGQPASIDTRNGVVPGHVVRVDPAVQNGTVLVEIKLDGPLPRGARPDLSVEGTIELERLDDVLYVGRPVQGQPDSTVGLFRVQPDGRHAHRVPVKLGRNSVSTVEIVDGLQVGDRIILSDMSQYDGVNRVRVP
ncbi:MAG: HlyD family efflux transporter periplasmic adaptor subunit [Verrucomicrobiales bacterium]|nr:HlyD family efflux transporter periplasmic adaptor subunit [Verrucomicrobiales bacterium]